MPPSDPASSATAVVNPPRIPTAEELYDLIMAKIEPDLTSEGIAAQSLKYKDEPKDQFEDRKKRYLKAFDLYDQAYQGYMTTLQSQVTGYRRTSFLRAEVEDRREEDGVLQKLEKSISPKAA